MTSKRLLSFNDGFALSFWGTYHPQCFGNPCASLEDQRSLPIGLVLGRDEGLRVGELPALKWEDMNFTSLEVNVTRSI